MKKNTITVEQYDTGMGTDSGMWEMVDDALVGEKLTESVSKAIYALCEDRAVVILKSDLRALIESGDDGKN